MNEVDELVAVDNGGANGVPRKNLIYSLAPSTVARIIHVVATSTDEGNEEELTDKIIGNLMELNADNMGWTAAVKMVLDAAKS